MTSKAHTFENALVWTGPKRSDEWSLRAFASMPSTAIFLRARVEIKDLLCELASDAKIWGARASEHFFKFCEQR